jgi:5-methylcytosine-specific restriction protein A
MTQLSKEFWLVAFYLSKFGNTLQGKETTPPVELNAKSWKDAYKFFYEKFSGDKTIQEFENSLKNCRDTFDGHIDNSSRIGWRDLEGKPIKLPTLAKSVFNKYNSISREVIWDELQQLLSAGEKKGVTEKPSSTKEKKTNPDWTREELILALNLYFDLDQGQMHKGHPDVIRVSNELRELNIHKEIPDKIKFRNPSGISRRLANFKTMDSGYGGEGLANSGKLAKEVFKEFNHHRDKLRKEASLIRQLYLGPKSEKKTVAEEKKLNYQAEFLFQFHKNRETDPLVIKVKKEMVLSDAKSLKCEVCGFDSVSVYGELGRDLMEIHYNIEFQSEPALESSSMEDFIIICSNCHKVLDKNFALIDADDLKNIILKK